MARMPTSLFRLSFIFGALLLSEYNLDTVPARRVEFLRVYKRQESSPYYFLSLSLESLSLSPHGASSNLDVLGAVGVGPGAGPGASSGTSLTREAEK